MRMIREVIRLRHGCGFSQKKIASIVSCSHGAVGEYLKRAEAADLKWPLPEDLDDAGLEKLLYPAKPPSKADQRPQPNCVLIREELKKKGVTLIQLWAEYREDNPHGYGLSQFCDIYKKFNAHLAITMRQFHAGGDKAFSDFAGTKQPITCETTGEIRFAHLFVCTLGASNYTFARLYHDETAESWCNGQAAAFNFFGGTPVVIVPDNPKAVIIKASRYEPELNASFSQMAAHYNVAVIPARVRRPQDKAKVEAAVGLATRWILAVLRKRTFHSLAEANVAVAELLSLLNEKKFQKRPGSRKTLFEEVDKPLLRPLPNHSYEFCDFKKASVNIDYHFVFEQHMYSVHHRHRHRFAKVELRITNTTIEVLLAGNRIASHTRKYAPGGFTTLPEHQPTHHRDYGNWSPDIMVKRGEKIGPGAAQLFAAIMSSRAVPEQGFRSCQGILRLETLFGKDRLDAACARSLAAGGLTYKTVKSMLSAKMDSLPLPEKPVQLSIVHSHLREVASFNSKEKEVVNADSSNDRQFETAEARCDGERFRESAGS
jgi:transposase